MIKKPFFHNMKILLNNSAKVRKNMTPEQLLNDILSDIRVEILDEFDRNFERKGFFGRKWPPRKFHNNRGSVLMQSGKLRRSIHAQVRGTAVVFTSAVPYAAVHNEGWSGTRRAHTRRIKSKDKKTVITQHVKAHHVTIPERRFIGDAPEVRKAVEEIIKENVERAAKNVFRQK